MAEQENQGIVALINSVPGLRQGLLLAGLALSIAAGLWMVFWAQQPGYRLLYANLTDRDAAEVVQALQVAGIDYQGTKRAVRSGCAARNCTKHVCSSPPRACPGAVAWVSR